MNYITRVAHIIPAVMYPDKSKKGMQHKSIEYADDANGKQAHVSAKHSVDSCYIPLSFFTFMLIFLLFGHFCYDLIAPPFEIFQRFFGSDLIEEGFCDLLL